MTSIRARTSGSGSVRYACRNEGMACGPSSARPWKAASCWPILAIWRESAVALRPQPRATPWTGSGSGMPAVSTSPTRRCSPGRMSSNPSPDPGPPDDLAAVGALAPPDARLRPADPQMHGPAARTRRLPAGRLLGGHRHDGPAGRVAHVLERQRRAGLAPAAVAGQAPRSPVEVDGLLAGRAGRLPVAGLHDGLARRLAGPGRGPQPDGDGLPPRAVPGGGAGDGVGDLVPERVEDRLLGAVAGRSTRRSRSASVGTCRRPAAASSSPGRRSSRAGRAPSTPRRAIASSCSRSISAPSIAPDRSAEPEWLVAAYPRLSPAGMPLTKAGCSESSPPNPRLPLFKPPLHRLSDRPIHAKRSGVA